MKKILLAFVTLFTLLNQAKAGNNYSLSGPAYVCPGSITSYTCTGYPPNHIGTEFTVMYTLSSYGNFDPMQTGVLYSGGKQLAKSNSSGTETIDWSHAVNGPATLTAVITYTVLGVAFNTSCSMIINVGIVGVPNAINAPYGICADYDAAMYGVSCPNSLAGTQATNYYWTISGNGMFANGTQHFAGSSTSFGVSQYATDLSPIVISVQYSETCGGFNLSGAYSISVPVSSGPPASAYGTHPITTGLDGSKTAYFYPAANSTLVELSYDNINWSAPLAYQYINVSAGSSQGVWIRSANGCNVSVSAHVTITAPPCPTCPKTMVTIPKATTEVEIKDVNVYPNPANEQLNISIPALGEAVTVSIYNLNGQVVKTTQLEGNMITPIDISTLSGGMYLVRIVSAEGTLRVTKKIQVVK
jgi:hypothetical protein